MKKDDDVDRRPKLGQTGKFPDGSLCDGDEGEATFAVYVDTRLSVVSIDFGTPITWLGLTVEDAKKMAEVLGKAADTLGLLLASRATDSLN